MSKRLRKEDDQHKMLIKAISSKNDKEKNIEIKPLNDSQKYYINSINVNTLTFGIGPAGTGKTWLSTMMACKALKERKIERIYLTRPAVEAGEKLGFLPGELQEKYEPYIAPLREIFHDFFGKGYTDYLLKSERIVPVPLGYMRGMTIRDGWLIADEMQNASKDQMKMLLTRIGDNSKFIINGDPRQTDIGMNSGLIDAVNRLEKIKSVSAIKFNIDDVVRSGICQEIIKRYEN